MQQDNATFVCHVCIEDCFLSKEVKELGSPKLCSYCSGMREAHSLEFLAGRIYTVLEQRFKLVCEDFRQRSGTPVEQLIAEMAGLNEEIAYDVRDLLSDRYSEFGVTEDNPFSEEAHYEELEVNDLDFRDVWSEFCRYIRSRARFFSTYAEKSLRIIFGDLHNHRTVNDQPVFREIGPNDEARFIWRARKSQSDNELKAILQSPAREIGPPPSRVAQGGRMNAPGIPVFYGAMDEATCVAEARAPVGSKVVVAKFELLRTVRLLDFDALAEIFVKDSHFDPDYYERAARTAFLKRLVREMSRPVLPQDETFEYLATQFVTEYLANKLEPRLDGIIFRSSQTGGTGRNLVLFNHACGVEPYKLPKGIQFKFFIPRDSEDDSDIHILEKVLSDPPTKAPPSVSRQGFGSFLNPSVFEPWRTKEIDREDDGLWAYRKPCLRLELESVVVHDIKGVCYESVRRRVSRTRNAESN